MRRLEEFILSLCFCLQFCSEMVVSSQTGFDLDDAEIKKFKIWPSGVIPYFIDDFSFDKVLRDRIRDKLQDINSMTGLSFQELPSPPASDNERWVMFINRRGQQECSDVTTQNFTNEGVQRVILGYDCINDHGQIGGAVLALAGVPPMHNAPDRDEVIKVNLENVIPDKKSLFDKLKNDEWLFHDLEYDFVSAGHFSFHKYTANGKATITPLDDVDAGDVGETQILSKLDVLKIQRLYSYITKKERYNRKIPECKKIFQPGQHFHKYEPNKFLEEPLEKPSNYTGKQSTTKKPQESNEAQEDDQLDNEKNTKHPSREKLKGTEQHPIFEESDYNTEEREYLKKISQDKFVGKPKKYRKKY